MRRRPVGAVDKAVDIRRQCWRKFEANMIWIATCSRVSSDRTPGPNARFSGLIRSPTTYSCESRSSAAKRALIETRTEKARDFLH